MVFTRSQTKAIYDTYFDEIKTAHAEFANGKWRKNNVFLNNTKCIIISQINTMSEQEQDIYETTLEIAEKAYEDFYGDGMRVKFGFNGPIVAISYHYD